MLQVLTAKLKLIQTRTQQAALRATQLAYLDGRKAVSRYSFAHDKLSSPAGLQGGVYAELRSAFRLRAQLACAVCRQVGATYKGL